MGVIARQSIKGALANYLGVAIGFFVSFFVLTKYLTQEEIGLTRVMVDAAILFSSVAQLGSNSSIVKFFPYFKDGKNNHGVFGLSVLLPMVGFMLFALAFLIFREPLLGIYSKNAPLLADYFYLLPMLTFFALYLGIFETNASVLLRITVPKLVREVGIRLFNLATYLLYGFDLISLDVFVWLFCGSYGLAMMLNLFYLISLGHISFRIDRGFLTRERVKEIGRYTLFMTAVALAGNIPLFNSLFLGAKTGLALTGVYTIASYIANVVEVPYRSLGAISRLLIFYLIWINVDALFQMIPNGKDFAGGVGVVFLLGMAKVLNSSFSVGTDILNFSRHYPWGLVFIAVLTTSAILFNLSFIDMMGINGAACATLSAYIIYFLLLNTFLWRRMRVNVFCIGHLKMMLLIVVLLALDWGWNHWLTPVLPLSIIVGAVLKTLVLGSLSVAAVLGWKISPTVNRIVKKYSPYNKKDNSAL